MKIDSSLAAVVTGGASGLGLATVKALRAAGAKVAIFDLNEETGNKSVAALHEPRFLAPGSSMSSYHATT